MLDMLNPVRLSDVLDLVDARNLDVVVSVTMLIWGSTLWMLVLRKFLDHWAFQWSTERDFREHGHHTGRQPLDCQEFLSGKLQGGAAPQSWHDEVRVIVIESRWLLPTANGWSACRHS